MPATSIPSIAKTNLSCGDVLVLEDPAINPAYIELYADPTARGGILEAEGTVEIKFREKELLATMQRLDPECARLAADIKQKKEELKRVEAQAAAASTRASTSSPLNRRESQIFKQPQQRGESKTGSPTNFELLQTAALTASASALAAAVDALKKELAELEKSLRKHQESLSHAYHQVAINLVDLHDNPTRMLAKGTHIP